MEKQNPILNNPYEEPKKHYATAPDGTLNYADIRKGRRIFTPDIQAIPVRQGPQSNLFEVNDLAEQYEGRLINLVRAEVGKWRDSGYASPVPTRVTKELLDFWFVNPERQSDKRLFLLSGRPSKRQSGSTKLPKNPMPVRTSLISLRPRKWSTAMVR